MTHKQVLRFRDAHTRTSCVYDNKRQLLSESGASGSSGFSGRRSGCHRCIAVKQNVVDYVGRVGGWGGGWVGYWKKKKKKRGWIGKGRSGAFLPKLDLGRQSIESGVCALAEAGVKQWGCCQGLSDILRRRRRLRFWVGGMTIISNCSFIKHVTQYRTLLFLHPRHRCKSERLCSWMNISLFTCAALI